MDLFDIDIRIAEKMTTMTKGYPFAFQVLGYLYWENREEKNMDGILRNMTSIWRIKSLRERLGMKAELFSVYRDGLKRKGVVDTREYGRVTLALPRFDFKPWTDAVKQEALIKRPLLHC